MARPSLESTLAALATAVVCGALLAGCGGHHEPGVDEPAREGLAIDVAGIDYNVFLTRQLNIRITPDKAYYDGEPPEPGTALYGVFIEACNRDGGEPLLSTDDFVVTDNQGNEFEPVELPEENAFAYHARELGEGDCIPEEGSITQQGPTAGAMLLFNFPLESTENRPLELTISGPAGAEESKLVELDI